MTKLCYQGLTLRVGATPVLDEIHLVIEGPGVFVLLGPSGVGKSSFLRATQRLIDHGRDGWSRGGDVLFNGRSIFSRRLPQQELARSIGFVQQRPRMLHGSARSNVEFALHHTTDLSQRAIRAKAEEALERVGLSAELADLEVAAWKLSGGQAQRLAIARAIALEPEMLLLDEPISALDPLSAERVEEVIHALAAERLVVMVTHKVGLAVRLADSAGFMLRGEAGARLVEVGDAPEIFLHPADPVALEFVQMGYGQVGKEAAQRGARPHEIRAHAESLRRDAARKDAHRGKKRRLAERLYLFVCGRNTSRSPVAEAICNAEIIRRLGGTPRGVRATSAGLDAEPGEPMSVAAGSALGELGYAPHEHLTRSVSTQLVERAEQIFCMTGTQVRALVGRFPTAAGKVERLDPIADLANPRGKSPELVLETMKRLRDAVRWRLARDGGVEFGSELRSGIE